MQTISRTMLKLLVALLLVAGLFSTGHASAASLPTSPCVSASGTAACELWATTGTATVFGATTVNIWGYSTSSTSGTATLPGPILIVNQGDTVTVTLHNGLTEDTALFFQGQSMVPDTTGVAAGGTATYTFSANHPGTFLYEAGLIPGKQHQVAMGMYGALVVKPSDGTAYGSTSSAYDEEALLVLSEFDTALAATPATFDMRNYAPKYFLINGKAYATPFTGDITVTPGNKVLLRYVNAGLQSHAMSTLGISQKVLAQDGYALAHPHSMVAETIATGQTLDALVTIPATSPLDTRFAIYDANLMLRNANASTMGGMLTFLKSGSTGVGGGGPDTTGPSVTSTGLLPNPTNGTSAVTVSATISDVASGNSPIAAAEFYVDSTSGSPTAMTPVDSVFDTSTESVTGTISTALLGSLASGNHTIYVRGQDSLGNWGAFVSSILNLDMTGPATSGLTLSPNPSSGAVSVALTAIGNDTASGNNNVTAAEYWVDAGAPTTMTAVGSATPTRNFTATIPAGLSMGTHIVSVRSQDALGNWGAVATINLQVADVAAPTTSNLLAAPNPNNGTTGLSTSIQAVRVTADFSDVATGNSNIATAEGFVDTVGTTGTGFVFIANDGLFNSPAESGYSDIPLAVVGTLSQGNHTIYVHAKDAAGNWNSTFAQTTLVIDKTAPTFTSITINPTSVVQGTTSIAMTVNGAADTGGGGLTNPLAGEYWFDANTATAFTGATNVSIATGSLAVGSHTLSVRIRDNANNWSTIHTATLTVVPDPIFSNSFETATGTTRPWGWTSASTTTTGRLNVTTTAALVGTLGLQAQGNNTNYVQFNYGTTANPAWGSFDARFYFRPNGESSTGKDIFVAATGTTYSSSQLRIRVRYRLNGTTPQVQIQADSNNTNTTWTNILGGTSNNYIEVVWQAGGNLQLYVNGVLAQTLTADTGTINTFRLGSVTNTGNSTLMYFDAFVAKRSVSPLFGP